MGLIIDLGSNWEMWMCAARLRRKEEAGGRGHQSTLPAVPPLLPLAGERITRKILGALAWPASAATAAAAKIS